MSFNAIQAVLEHSQTTGPARAIMLILAYRANEQWECWPGIEGISKNAGLSRDTTIRHIKNIRKAGEISVIRGGHILGTPGGKQVSNRYKLILKGSSAQLPPNTKGGSAQSQGGSAEDHKGVAHSHKGGSAQLPELKGNRNNQPTLNRNPEKAGGGDGYVDPFRGRK